MKLTILVSALFLTACSAEAEHEPAPDPTTASAAADAPYRIIKQGPSKGNLFALRSDGSEHQEWDYPDGVDHAVHPDWSWDGRQIVFSTDRRDGSRDILVSPADGGTARMVIDSPPGTISDNPAWSPDGRYLAYNTNTEGSRYVRLVVADVATGDEVATYRGPDRLDVVAPRWRPDGLKLVVEVGRYRLVDQEWVRLASWLAVVDPFAERPELTAVTPKGIWAQYPDWSPDGSAISFTAGNPDPFTHEGDPSDLFTVAADGTNLTRLTYRNAWEQWIGTPEWNADGFLVSLIGYEENYTLATVSGDGRQITAIEDADGNAIPGAHPRADRR